MLLFEAFEQSVRQQGVTLNPSLLMIGELYDRHFLTEKNSDLWPSDAISGTLQTVAIDLRTSPYMPLAVSAEPIALDALPPERMVRALGAMINASMTTPPERPNPSGISFPGSTKTIDNCLQAEVGFLAAYRQVARHAKRDIQTLSRRIDNGVRLVVDAEDQPVLIQKSAGGVWSALTVREIYINDIPHPPGSIVRVSYLDPGNKKKPPEGLTVLPVAAVGSVAFQRLSTFAIDPDQRPKKRWKYGRSFLDRQGLRKLTIEKIARIATQGVKTIRKRQND